MTNPKEAIYAAEEKTKDLISDLDQKIKQGTDTVNQAVSRADKHLRENPWPIVAGTAVTFLVVGFLMGASRKG